jgi:hypothetical protein
MSYSITKFECAVQSTPCLNILIDIEIVKSASSSASDLVRLRIENQDGSSSRSYNYPADFVSTSESTTNNITTFTLQLSKTRSYETANNVFIINTEGQTLPFVNKLLPVQWFITGQTVVEGNFVPVFKKDRIALNNLDLSLLDFEYSLDDSTYSSNLPVDQDNGNYTLFVKDYIGCKKSVDYTIFSSITYTIDSFEVSESSTPCDTVIVDMVLKRALSDLALDSVVINEISGFFGQGYRYPQDFISTNSFEQNGFVFYELEFEKNRTNLLSHNVVVVTSDQVQTILEQKDIPVKWILSSVNVISIQIGTSTASGRLIKTNSQELNNNEKLQIGIEASLNGSDFGANTIAGLEDGNYTYHVRDAFGCVQTLDFLVGGADDQDPEIFVSLLNSVRFAKRNLLIRNYENELSYEDQTDTNYGDWFNKYPVGQDLRIQYQSSYSDNKAFLIKDDDVTELPVSQLTDNRNVKDIRDGRAFYNGTDLFVFFPEGSNIYNESGDVIGVNFLDGSLLSYNEIGTFIEVQDIGTLRIKGFRTVTVDSINYEAMELDYSSTGGNFSLIKKITTVFTKQKFDFFEFQINGFALGCYQLAICDSNNFDNQDPLASAKYLSERILITADIEKSHYIEWFNTENNQIGWSTGIKSRIYLPFVMPPTFEPEDENEVYTTDTRQFLLESESFENYNFHLDLVPLAIARQIQLLLSSDNVLIDDINYVKKDTPEIEAQEGSNLYLVRPKLAKSTNYNSNSNIGETINNNPSTIDGSKGILKLN